MEQVLKKIRTMCRIPHEGTSQAIVRMIDEVLGAETINPLLIEAINRYNSLSDQETEEKRTLEQKIAEEECPFKPGDIIRGSTYTCDGVDPDICRTLNCDEKTCPQRKLSPATQSDYFVGAVFYYPSHLFKYADHGTHYIAVVHKINQDKKPSRSYEMFSSFGRFDCMPATKIGSGAPPVYYQGDTGNGQNRRYLSAFLGIDSEAVIQKAKEKRIYNPLPDWAKSIKSGRIQ